MPDANSKSQAMSVISRDSYAEPGCEERQFARRCWLIDDNRQRCSPTNVIALGRPGARIVGALLVWGFAMKYFLLLILLLLSASFSVAQRRSGDARPNMQTQQDQKQNTTEFDRMNAQTQQQPSAKQLQAADAVRLKQDAHELALLAQSVPPDVEQTTNGILPKDLDQRLRRIEKLAKELRSRISH